MGMLLHLNVIAQTNPPVLSFPLSPQIEWKNTFWPETDMYGNPTEQQNSGEDWYYDLIEYKKNGMVAGYAAVGFSGDPNFNTVTFNNGSGTALSCYNLSVTGSPSCYLFESENNRFGKPRQIIVFYDLQGNITSYYRYNVGDLYGLVQDDNEDIYLFGNASNLRNLTESNEVSLSDEPHLGSAPIYYNPTQGTQTAFPLSCDIFSDDLRPKFNIIKINTDGEVLWNNYYGLPNSLTDAFAQQGTARTGIVQGMKLLVGGVTTVYANQFDTKSSRKFLVSINKTNGYLNWKKNFQPGTRGDIRQIKKEGNSYLISGIEWPSIPNEQPAGYLMGQAFVSRCEDNGTLFNNDFNTPVFYERTEDIPGSVDVDGIIDNSRESKSTSAIFSGGKIYWFIAANNQTFGAANGICEGVVVEMAMNGSMTAMDTFGEIRAYDLWISGTPTDDGGFALVTSRQSPVYYETGTLPTYTTPLYHLNPNGPTIGDCLTDFQPCDVFDEPNGLFWTFMSTCSYVRKYDANFTLQWDKIWDSSDNGPRECYPKNLKQQECVYRIVQSSVDGGLALCGNTSDNWDDSYIVKLKNDCGISDFFGMAEGTDLIVDYTDGVYDINVNTTWTTPKKVLGLVRVKPGITLTIQTTEVEFATGSGTTTGIDVEQNGHLIVDNSLLTSTESCDGMWSGISVWGDTDEHQSSHSGGQYYQGRATIRNNSTIEFASTGVRNWKPGFHDQRGGIVRVTNSHFLNCSRAAEFMSYQNKSPNNETIHWADRSYIHNSTFIVNDFIPLDLTVRGPLPQITLWKTDRVSIRGCDFINTSTSPNSENRSRAIYSHDANYLVTEICNDPNPLPAGVPCVNEASNTFMGWHKAIEALETNTGRPILVRNSTFSENMIGVALQGLVDGSEIYLNDFFLGNHPYEYEQIIQTPELANLGIHTTETHIFNIEDNDFERASDATFDAHGVLIHNSKDYNNELYRNTFTDLKVAANGWQLNRNANAFKNIPAGGIGLQFLCNWNTGNERDFVISRLDNGLDEFDLSGMRNNQGNLNPPLGARNTFSSPTSDPNILTHWTVNSDQDIFHRYNHNSNPPDPNEVSPQMDIEIVSAENACLTNYPTGDIVEVGRYHDMLTALDEFGSIQYTYTSIIDNGNTPGTLNDIALTWPNNAWQLRDELMVRSPYNSEEVLISAALKEIMPHAMLLEVLLANPDALRSGRILSVVKNDLLNPMPAYMTDMLLLAQSENTLRSSMESAMSYWHATASGFQKQALASKHFNMVDMNEPDSTLLILSKIKTPTSDLARSGILMRQGNFVAAINLIDSINTSYKLLASEHQDMVNLKNLYLFMAQLHGEGTEIPEMDAEEIASMRSFAENPNGGITAQKAQNALCFHHNICYSSDGTPKSNTPQDTKPYPTKQDVLSFVNTTNVYPNPAMNYTTIQYKLLKATENTHLNVYDALGRRVQSISLGKVYEGQTILDIREQANGVYIYDLIQDGKQVLNGKFIVNR